MSLDVALVQREQIRCPKCYSRGLILEQETIFDYNITHNLTTMASKAGIYKHLWRPEELNITKAVDLIDPLSYGLRLLKKYPDFFKEFEPDNGWGTYDGLVKFVEAYLAACKENPTAEIETCR